MRKRKNKPVALEKLLKTAPESHRLSMMEVKTLNAIQRHFRQKLQLLFDMVEWRSGLRVGKKTVKQLLEQRAGD